MPSREPKYGSNIRGLESITRGDAYGSSEEAIGNSLTRSKTVRMAPGFVSLGALFCRLREGNTLRKRFKHLAVALAFVGAAITGGSFIQPEQASAHHPVYGYYHVWYNGQWHYVPKICYFDDATAQYFGYYNAKTCRMNNMGYYGIYP